jgi:hypothetical protein
METARYWIDTLSLLPHPEGGWYRETYRCRETIPGTGLPQRFGSPRSFSTAIYFLLASGQFSAWHRIKSDELWFFHAGCPLAIHCLTADGGYHTISLGNTPDQGQSLQAMVPAGSWFAAQPLAANSFTLVSCTVAPGFDFSDFEMGERHELLTMFPRQREIIEQLSLR